MGRRIKGTDDRQKQGPGGLAGAPRAEPGRVFLESGRPMKAKGHTTVAPGDCMVLQTPGGAGYGNPAERSAASGAQDRAEGLEA